LCKYHDSKADIGAIPANIGSSLLINTPSNCDKNPKPILAPSDANNGKQEAHPIAAIMVPNTLVAFEKDATFILLSSLIETFARNRNM
jgi:hypothetical protein